MNFSHTGFVRGYKVAMLWVNAYCESPEGEYLRVEESDDLFPTIWDFTPEAEAQVLSDCEDFLSGEGITGLIESVLNENYDSDHAGHDFALTRNSHGAGFWDRGFGEAGDKLSDWASTFGEANLWVDTDEKVHCE